MDNNLYFKQNDYVNITDTDKLLVILDHKKQHEKYIKNLFENRSNKSHGIVYGDIVFFFAYLNLFPFEFPFHKCNYNDELDRFNNMKAMKNIRSHARTSIA